MPPLSAPRAAVAHAVARLARPALPQVRAQQDGAPAAAASAAPGVAHSAFAGCCAAAAPSWVRRRRRVQAGAGVRRRPLPHAVAARAGQARAGGSAAASGAGTPCRRALAALCSHTPRADAHGGLHQCGARVFAGGAGVLSAHTCRADTGAPAAQAVAPVALTAPRHRSFATARTGRSTCWCTTRGAR